MSKTPTTSQARTATTKKKTPSTFPVSRTNSARSRSPIRKSQSAVGLRTRDTDKENNNPKESFDDASSDISSDKIEQDQLSTKSSYNKRRSPVHEFAVKMSTNEYQCKICSKVRNFILLFYNLEGVRVSPA